MTILSDLVNACVKRWWLWACKIFIALLEMIQKLLIFFIRLAAFVYTVRKLLILFFLVRCLALDLSLN